MWLGVISLVAHSFIYDFKNIPDYNQNMNNNSIQQPMNNNNYNQNTNNNSMQQPMNNNYNQMQGNNEINQNNNLDPGVSTLHNYKICNACLTKCDAQNEYCYKCGAKL